MARARPDQRGNVTVLAAGAVVLMMLVAVVTVGLAGLVAASHQVAAAADLAALAGARTAGDPCATARRTAERNGAMLRDCSVEGLTVLVVVERRLRGPFGVAPTVTGQARAGPPFA